MTDPADDARWMGAALALASRARGLSTPNPNVGCIVVRDGRVLARGWTGAGGRPHAEAVALTGAGPGITGSTVYVTLEPCAHQSVRGPACAELLAAARPARVVIAARDPDPRTDGKGIARLQAAGIEVVSGIRAHDAEAVMAGFFMRQRHKRPHVSLKIATSIDGRIAMADGTSRWITGEAARRHGHLERARADLIVVGRGTYDADQPRLDVRLDGLEDRAPRRALLSRRAAPEGWTALASPTEIAAIDGVDHVLVEGGAGAAAAFLDADLVDRLLVYRAPILIGEGKASIGALELGSLDEAHGRWRMSDRRSLGSDTLEVYQRTRN